LDDDIKMDLIKDSTNKKYPKHTLLLARTPTYTPCQNT